MLQPDTMLGIYRLIERIGAGGMGEVWRAEDTRLGRAVAIKVLPASVAQDSEAIARMRREARTAAQINHPNVATIHAVEEIDDLLFIVMELVQGEPLSRMMARGLTEAEVCRIGRGVAEALAEAHEKGIVHRDIKPDNVIVAGSRVKVLDFGIAKEVGVTQAGPNDPTSFQTRQGYIVGTVQYMSPEQALGKQLDAKTDVFSLGVMLYQAATGALPFHGETVTDTITKIIRDEPPAPRALNPNMSPGLAAIIARSMRKNRDERWSAAELAAALEDHLLRAPTLQSTAPAATEHAFASAPTAVKVAAPTVVERAPRRFIGGALVAVLLLGTIAALAYFNRAKPKPKPQPPKVVAAAPTTSAIEVVAEPTITTAPITQSEEPPPPPPPAPATSNQEPATPTIDQLYAEGVAFLRQRRPREAAEKFIAVVEQDPRHARAHLRLGVMALFERDPEKAREELTRARENRERLSPTEERVAELAWAISNGDRETAREILRELRERNPRDPELELFRRHLDGEGPPPRGDRPPPRRRFRP